MFLIIDTCNQDYFILALASQRGDLIFQKKAASKFQHSEKLLPAIRQFLKSLKIGKEKLIGIIAVTGPGGFTSVRVGVITANSLSFALKIPIYGFRSSEFKNYKVLAKKGADSLAKNKKKLLIAPFYGSEPNITKPAS